MGSLSVWVVLVLVSFCSSVHPASSHHLCLRNQRDALLHFKNSIFIIDDCSPRTETWNKSIDCCSWQGVKCDNLTGHVIGINLARSCISSPLSANNTLFNLRNLRLLDLSSNYLRGSNILDNSSSSLFHLHGLQRLNLASNYLEGNISSELFTQLVSLTHLNLSSNGFSGLIPYEISLLSSLVSLDLSENIFSGLIPCQIGLLSSLVSLDLSENRLSGLIPRQISLLSNLVSLDLSYNVLNYYGDQSSIPLRFDGQGFEMLATNLTKLTNLVLYTVDMSDVSVTSFLNLTSSLRYLGLGFCELHGELPPQLFQLPNLKDINLGSNGNLTGYLPNRNWSSGLESLSLSNNGFRGPIPSSFGNLTQIISMDLSGNWLQGEIPDVFGNLTSLTYLKFSYCNLSGPLPLTMFNLTQITSIDMSYNHLEGPLPNHVSELQLLGELVLTHNSISGGLPSWIFTLPSLTDLDLSHNKLASSFARIQKPSSVLHVDLSYNDIHGPIPDSISYLVNLASLDLSSNNLSGSIPDPIFGLEKLSELDLSSNNLSGVVNSNMLSKLTILSTLDVSNNSLLSLSTSGNDVNYSFPSLSTVLFSGCSVKQFPSFFRTSKLEVLDLSNNKLTGGISKWEAQGWENLQVLNISHNSLTSLQHIPGKKLGFLDFNSNLLQGTVLDLQILTPGWLTLLSISNNNLTGSIPSSICNWTSLAVLDLSKNSLTGTIPECLGHFSYDLRLVNLQMNNLYGNIPDSFVNNTLSHLFLNDNQLEGLVPKSLANSASLQLLNLGNNNLTDKFPHRLASLPSLQVLILKSNRFHGSLPYSVASLNFSALRILDLSRNGFSGTLPTILFQNLRAMSDSNHRPSYAISYQESSRPEYYYQISVNVTTKRLELELTKIAAIFVSMDLSNNQFCGQIPEQVGLLISLHMLNFSHNNFTGPIPASFGNLVGVESLDLSTNKLGGNIPSEMTKLTFLEVLNLSENHLVGPIPHGKQFDTFDNDSYIGNMGLCGLPLSKQCDYGGGVQPPAPLVVEHETFWKAVMMGYGSGMVIGVSMGYIVFTTGRPRWLVRMVEIHLRYNFTDCIRRRNRTKRN